jgi:hypothetical protein
MSKKDTPLTELVDADIRRIDAVKGPANGNRFLIAKAEAPDMVSDDAIRALIAQPEGDIYLGDVIIKSEEAPEAPKSKEPPMAAKTAPAEKTPAAVVGDVKKAKAILKQDAKDRKTAKLVKRAKKIEKKALLAQVNALGIAKGTLGSLSDAHAALLDALKNEAGKDDTTTATMLQGFADKLAKLMSSHAASGGDGDEPEAEGEPDGDEPVGDEAPIEKTVSVKKARKIRKAAKIAKQTVRDQIATAKARKTLAKIGRRNNSTDQSHVDAIDEHAAALGASAHQTSKPVAPIAKATEYNPTIDQIQQIAGPISEDIRKAIQGDLAQISEQVAKIAKTALPGGPRVVLDRDGSVLAAGEGQQGMGVEQAALMKAASHFQAGSVERDKIEKKAAALAIKDLMAAQQ